MSIHLAKEKKPNKQSNKWMSLNEKNMQSTCSHNKMANEICGRACTNTLASIKHLAMTRSSIYEYIDLGVEWEHLIIGHTHRLNTSGLTTFA